LSSGAEVFDEVVGYGTGIVLPAEEPLGDFIVRRIAQPIDQPEIELLASKLRDLSTKPLAHAVVSRAALFQILLMGGDLAG
jgi:hypothetical protein